MQPLLATNLRAFFFFLFFFFLVLTCIDFNVLNSDPEEMVKTFNTNVTGPLRVFQALLPLIQKGNKKVFVSISSLAGMLEENRRWEK